MRVIRRIIAEPFVQFLALGAVIFGLFGAVADQPATDGQETITVSSARIEQLRAAFRRSWQRAPTGDELEGLINDFIRGEVLYREALALGLDRDDPVIRNRLRYKLEFLADSGAQLMEPEDQILTAFMIENAENYMIGPRIAFRQVYLGENPSAAAVEQTAATAAGIGAGPEWRDLGQRSLLPSEIAITDRRSVDEHFGSGFFEAIAGLPLDRWSGPVRSGFGLHLVHVTQREPDRAPELADIRGQVLRDWRILRARELKQAQFDSLRARYKVVIADEPAQ